MAELAVASHPGFALYKFQQRAMFLLAGIGSQIWHRLFERDSPVPTKETLDLLQQRYKDLLEQDVENVQNGYYPQSLMFQIPFVDYLSALPLGVATVPRIMKLKSSKDHQDLPESVDKSDYPAYYLRTFHWQTDGWLSEDSAALYDAGVEFLFAGTADIMRRMAIPHIVDNVRGIGKPKVLDLACGTGRFLKQLNAAIPQARLFGLDLSPYYLKFARKILSDVEDLSLIRENAETIPFGDGYFDAINCTFLFHELPHTARRRVFTDARRTLRDGGYFVVNDSIQMSDSPQMQAFMEYFPSAYHEPFYPEYVKDDLGELFKETGFEVVSSKVHLHSKVVVGKKT